MNKNKEVKKEVKKTNKKIVDISQELVEIKEQLLRMSKGIIMCHDSNLNLSTKAEEKLKTFSNHVSAEMTDQYMQIQELQKSLNNKFKCLIYALSANLVIGSIILLTILLKG